MSEERISTEVGDSTDLPALAIGRTPYGVTSTPNIYYYPQYHNMEKCFEVLECLKILPFEPIWITVYGFEFRTSRKECVFVDPDVYLNVSTSHPWTLELLDIKLELQKYLDTEFNYVLATFYEDGYADKRFDKENESFFDATAPTAILSYGANYTLDFIQRSKGCFKLNLEQGSLLVIQDSKWTYDIMADRHVHEARFSLAFRKMKSFVDSTLSVETPAEITSGNSNELIQNSDVYEPDCNIIFSPLFTSTPIGSPIKRSLEEDSAIIGKCLKLNTDYDLNMSEPTTIMLNNSNVCGNMSEYIPISAIDTLEEDQVENSLYMVETVVGTKTLKQFWISYQTCIFVELYQNKLRIQIREFYAKPNSGTGVVMNVLTFYELGRKIGDISCSLSYTSDSTIINNSLLLIVKHHRLLLKSFNEFRMYDEEIRLNPQQLINFCGCLKEVENYLIHYVFTQQLMPSICADIPYESSSMDSAFIKLKELIQQDLYKTYQTISKTSNSQHSYESVPHAVKMLCRVQSIQEEFLSKNTPLSLNIYNFDQLYNKLQL